MSTMTARSEMRFPSLAGPYCMWHDDCTAMDCEFFRRAPDFYEALALTMARPKPTSKLLSHDHRD